MRYSRTHIFLVGAFFYFRTNFSDTSKTIVIVKVKTRLNKKSSIAGKNDQKMRRVDRRRLKKIVPERDRKEDPKDKEIKRRSRKDRKFQNGFVIS